jgi:hypothetical protein
MNDRGDVQTHEFERREHDQLVFLDVAHEVMDRLA